MEEGIIIRAVKEKEIERICEIAVKAWKPIKEGYKKVMGEELFEAVQGDWKETKASEVRNAASNRPEMVWVTELKGEIVGFTTFKIDEEKKIGEICNNAVDQNFQGRGIGKKQHLKVLELLKEKGMKFAKVSTGLDEAHKPARISYEKIGFKPMISSVYYYFKL